MVGEPKNSSGASPRNVRRPRSTSAPLAHSGSSQNVMPTEDANAALLAHLTTAAMASQALSPPNPYGPTIPQGDYSHPNPFIFHDTPFNHGGAVNTQLPPFSALDFPWHQFLQGHQAPQSTNFQAASLHPEMTPHLYGLPSSPSVSRNAPRGDVSGHLHGDDLASNAIASSSVSAGASDQEQFDNETIAIAEEKRRRNTAASARFRIKKKQKTVNLERSVSDLTGRAEDLEREVAELRRENGWLKEIVMLKGSRIAGMNLASHILAEGNQRAAAGPPGFSTQSLGSRSRAEDTTLEDSSSEEEQEVSETAKRGKKKGKSRRQ